jgi:four helix bundle protein
VLRYVPVGVAHFKDLACWRLASEVQAAVYAVITHHRVANDRDFCHDIRRSARSAPANIAEGFGRYTHREFAHFLSIARASLTETENHLHHLREQDLVSPDEWTRLTDLVQRAQRATSALRTYLMKTPDRRHR